MKGGKGSKNNIANRGASAKVKEINGKKIIPVSYRGANVGHGNFIAGMYEDTKKLVLDPNGVPVPYQLV